LPGRLCGDGAAGGCQDSKAATAKPQTPAAASDVQTRITIEVTGGEKNVPVENASVYVKFIEERAIKKDTKLELNVKTSRDGIAHVPNGPHGESSGASFRRRMEDVRPLDGHHRPEADDQGAPRQAAEVVLKELFAHP